MKCVYLSFFLLLSGTFIALDASVLTEEFVEYHIKAAEEEIDEDVFHLIHENIKNLENCNVREDSTNELIFLIEEGFTIDPFNMSKLIETLTFVPASNSAKKIIIFAIENKSRLNSEHLASLIKILPNVNASNNATTIILRAIELGIEFGAKERLLLTEMSKKVNAQSNVKKIRKALHDKATQKGY